MDSNERRLTLIIVVLVSLSLAIGHNSGAEQHETEKPHSVGISQNANGSVKITVWSMNTDEIVVEYDEETYALKSVGDSVRLNPSREIPLVIVARSDGKKRVIKTVGFDSEFINRKLTN